MGESIRFQPVYMVLGVGGLVGDAFYTRLYERTTEYRIFGFDHSRADISNRDHIGPLVSFIKPSVVINCAAVNDPEMCEEAKEGAYRVNAVGAQILAEECSKHGAKLVHVSACSVFDGKRASPYTERCKPEPLNIHGKSKYEGEKAIAKAIGDHLIIRPGWCFNFEGDNPITDWVARAERGLNIPVLSDCQGSPTYVPDLVDATLELIAKDAKGVFHVANSNAATWMSFAEAVVGLAKMNGNIVTTSEKFQSMFKAPIPRYTVMSTRKYSVTTGKEIRGWMEALKQCLFQMHRYKP